MTNLLRLFLCVLACGFLVLGGCEDPVDDDAADDDVNDDDDATDDDDDDDDTEPVDATGDYDWSLDCTP